MRRASLAAALAAVLSNALATSVGAADPELPVVAGKQVLATVNGDPVTLDEFFREFASVHEGAQESERKIHKQNPTELLERLVNVRLVVQEATMIGLDALPEVKEPVEAFGRDVEKNLLFEEHVRSLPPPAPGRVEERYSEAAREIRATAIMIRNEKDARDLEARMKAGGSFDALARELVEAGAAEQGQAGQFLKTSELMPEVAGAVGAMKPGDVSPLVRIGDKFTMFRLEEVRVGQDAELRKKIERETLQQDRAAAVRSYVESLKQRYAKTDAKLLQSLDFDAKEPGFDAFLTDRRTLAEIKGEEPVRVSDLAEAFRKRYFHGIARAAEQKKLNLRKSEVLDELLNRRVVLKESRRLKIDRSDEYRARVKDYQDGMVFGMFVQRVIDPAIRVDEAALRKYLAAHPADFTSPEMMRLQAIPFRDRGAAEGAIEKLRKGADFAWVQANAEGRLTSVGDAEALTFPDAPVLTADLPAGVRKAVAGASSGNYRFFHEEKGPHHVIWVREVIPPMPETFEAARSRLETLVRAEQRQKELDQWIARLRAASDVRVHAKKETFDRILGVLGSTGS